MDDELLKRLARFERRHFPKYRKEYRRLVAEGQHPRLVAYPMVARGMEQGTLFLHGWHYIIEDGRILILDVESGAFEPTDVALADQQPAADSVIYQLQ